MAHNLGECAPGKIAGGASERIAGIHAAMLI